jgi:transcriptional regulator with XRE-family HTH domain
MAENEEVQAHSQTVGERLREAREAKGMTLEEVASQTRIPTRHLRHIEVGDWDGLPAVTYSVGFARSYANAVGLDGPAIGAEVRRQLGSGRRSAGPAEYYEPADPARVPPRPLAIAAAIIALLLVAGYLIFRSGVEDGAATGSGTGEVEVPMPPPTAAPLSQPPSSATGSVVLTASDTVWIRITAAGSPPLYEGELAAGQRFEVPASAQQPQLRAGRPDALRVTVGQTAIPQLGPAGQPVGNVSLAPADLLGRVQGGRP